MEEGYEESDRLGSGISLDPRKEKLCLVRMPHDFDPEILEKAKLAAILLKGGDDSTPSKGGKKLKQHSGSFVEGHGLGDGYHMSIDTKSNEVSTFRVVVSGVVEGQCNIGPAFDSVVSISKKVVDLDSKDGKGIAALNLKQLPKDMVMKIPASYVKKDQVEGLKHIYTKENKEQSSSSGKKKRKSNSAVSTSGKSSEKKAKKTK